VRHVGTEDTLDSLGRAFAQRFGGTPGHLARAPGRVNLIGEHTDYNDLPVLPMALQREVKVAFRERRDDLVRVANVSDEFDPVEFRIRPGIERSSPGHWGNYVKAPFDELARRFGIRKGLDGVVTSDLPVASPWAPSSSPRSWRRPSDTQVPVAGGWTRR
jgi:galactokinase